VNASCGGRAIIAGATVGYAVYIGINAPPDFTVAPSQFSATLPITVSTTPPGSGTKTYNVVIRYRNAYGLESQNQHAFSFTIDSAGLQMVDPPPMPQQLSVYLDKDNIIRVLASYMQYDFDAVKATRWKLWVSTSAIDTTVDAPYQTDIVTGKTLRPLLTGSLAAGDYNMALCLYRDTDSLQSLPAATAITVPPSISTPTVSFDEKEKR